ncbi:MAG: alpha/beta hydrolase [Nanoarchaeota archaeon]|nr:alpha/beta hydrolase [Nanoarchaeota archaeon]
MKKEIKIINKNLGDTIHELYYSTYTLFGTKNKVDKINNQSILEAKKNKSEITILLHGMLANYYKTMFFIIKFFRKNNIPIVSVGYDYKDDFLKSSKLVKEQILGIMKKAGIKKVNIIGVCLGGVIARIIAEELDGKKFINKLITVYAPFKPVSHKALGYKINDFLGNLSKDNDVFLRDYKKKFTVKNHLAIFCTNDEMLGKQYPIEKKYSKNVIQIGIKGGHTLVSYSFRAMEIALAYLKEKKI